MKKYGLFIEDPYFTEYCKKYDKIFKSAVAITITNPHATCSAFYLSQLCNATLTIDSPNKKYDRCLKSIYGNIASVLKQIGELFRNVENAANKSAWYSELTSKYFLTDIEYLFLIIHRPTIKYYTEHPSFDTAELVEAQKNINVSEVLEHLHTIHSTLRVSGPSYGFRGRAIPNINDYEIVCTAHIVNHQRTSNYILFNTDSNKDADIENMAGIKHSQKIKTGVVHDMIDYCDKWNVDQLADSFAEININDLTIGGCSLNEKKHPQLADDPIFSPLLRTLEFRKNAQERAIPKLSYAKMANVALSLGISNYQNGKKLKKTELYDHIHAIPMY